MRLYIFCDTKFYKQKTIFHDLAHRTLHSVAETTETDALVVALYLIPGANKNRGTAFVQTWMSAADFVPKRGKWIFAKKWGTPPDLPPTFKLIRMRLDASTGLYPKTEIDKYGWEFRYETFTHHLATLFAHELHHFRRYHLKLHPKEGENAANRWALKHAQSLGFRVQGQKLRPQKRRRSMTAHLKKRRILFDPYASFRKLKTGDQLWIAHDPKRKYTGETVSVLRSIRSNSKRIVIQTADGRIWRWPMRWLKIVDE